MVRALVTGATGGLGRHVVKALLAAGYDVVASGRNIDAGDELDVEGAVFRKGDMRDTNYVRGIVDGVDTIFHCAALSSPWGKPEDFQVMNVEVTAFLISAAKAAGVSRFIHVSTPSLYFDFSDRYGVKETDPLAATFVNDYARTKAEAEQVVLHEQTELFSVAIIRPRAIFGEFDTVLLPRLERLTKTGFVPVFNKGAALADVTYAGNVADAMVLCDQKISDARGQIFNITNGEPVPVRDLLRMAAGGAIRKLHLVDLPFSLFMGAARFWESAAKAFGAGHEPPILPYTLGVMRYSQTLDITKARTILGYEPKVSIDEGLARYIRWSEAY